ncbi:MAG: YihY/virulence factor BrkB family protein [Desmonostoc vinosum HA7617-LM4]|nr:YihY/virulence factor BrkB family protein [Desmonostoc vinosum HA7617-LM4]
MCIGLHQGSYQALLGRQSSTGAGIIGFGLLLFSASTVFFVLSGSVNKIWRSHTTTSQSIRRTMLAFVLNQLLAFLLVFGIGLLLLASLISNYESVIFLYFCDRSTL